MFARQKVRTLADSSPEFDPLLDKAPARYVVGIDLGTTNSAVMYVDTQESPWQVRSFLVPQLVAPHQVEARETLPSFHFQSATPTAQEGALKLPWSQENRDTCVGVMARDEGTKTPSRLIASAKSWLCHSGVDRSAKLLPWQGAADVDRLSPVEASARFLSHVREAWDAAHRSHLLNEQDIVITLPASFDEVARELTVEAAAAAGLPNIVLIEEPQAAFYAWVYKHHQDWPDLVSPGDTILVCDIGGGTSDFTLIQVRQQSEEAEVEANGEQAASTNRVQFHRIAVGDHLILGGDNLDMALAHHVEAKLTDNGKLTPTQWDVLIRSCRRVKETLLSERPPQQSTVNLPGSGAKLIGGGLQTEVTREEVEKLLVDGFLPHTQLSEMPTQGQSGFREFGLPFASDPAITRHLAAFLTAHGNVAHKDAANSSAIRPDVVLFNGGFFASPVLRNRLLQVLTQWFAGDNDNWQPKVLDNDRLDLAVARGAAYYGMVRRGEGVRIAANLARSYYIEVDHDDQGASQAVCLVPGHAEPGQDIHLDALKLDLTISQPVEFSLLVSSTRLTDQPGQLVEVNHEQMKWLPPIRTVLRTERRNQTGTLPVTLHAHLSEIGTIELWCQSVDSDHRWRLQFDVRSATQTDRKAHETDAEVEGYVDEATWQRCEAVIDAVFGEDGTEKPSQLVKQLAAELDADRWSWPTSLLRRIWETLMERIEGRRRSPAHEARWLNLLGFSLRPGYGLAVDDWRVAETWRYVHGKLVHPGSRAEASILWRRLSGGLVPGQQRALAEPIISSLRSAHASSMKGKKAKGKPSVVLHESSEAWRLLGSLEHLSVNTKVQVGEMLADLFRKRKYEKVRNPMIWAMGRLGQRQPLYGPLNHVVPSADAERWCELLVGTEVHESSHVAAMQLARRTEDRYRDMDEKVRERVVQWMTETNAPSHLIELVESGGQLADEERDKVFGEALPRGLRIRAS